MKTAILHYWLVNRRGGERVLEELCTLFPDADIYTHVYAPHQLASPVIERHSVRTSFIGRLPKAEKLYQYYLPLMPLALEQLDLRGYDLVISSESGPAKGVITSPDTMHLCYCHSPMRYVWDMYHDYMDKSGLLKRTLVAPMMHYLRLWDRASADRVDRFIANSQYVSRRIEKCYRRNSRVAHPPVDLQQFSHSSPRDDFYLYAGELAPYKRPDLAVQAFNSLGKRLVVIGGGSMEAKLRELAGPTVEIMGRQPDSVLIDHYARCKALIFPGAEDFGIIPLEAMASGAPVLAYAKGGALETVTDGQSGLFFTQQSMQSIIATVRQFESQGVALTPEGLAEHAAKWDAPHFRTRMQQLIDEALSGTQW
ncbi:glycosyltransferase [Oleidesulfovibrio sp.]|uniref:glycosyltransferase n=1 Tax=Oleidesulfovibrio sp. TaxID=2909707 RepID=UPI003A8A763F